MAYSFGGRRPHAETDDALPGPRRGQKIPKAIITLLLVLVIIVGGVYVLTSFPAFSTVGKFYDSNWQAVFLTNGQVYFGKVTKIDSNYLYLENIYYLQLIAEQTALGQPPDVQEQPEQRLQLIKLGNEIHGPEDAMMINREHVVIVEELKSENSRVVQAIEDYVKNNNQ